MCLYVRPLDEEYIFPRILDALEKAMGDIALGLRKVALGFGECFLEVHFLTFFRSPLHNL
jgi:hypothetical protein